MDMTDTFCILPFMHLATSASGNLRVCCNSTPGKNFILKKDANFNLYLFTGTDYGLSLIHI